MTHAPRGACVTGEQCAVTDSFCMFWARQRASQGAGEQRARAAHVL